MTVPYRKKLPMNIPDEVGLVIAMLRNDLLNHKLKHVVPHDHIIRKSKELTFLQLPAILIEKVGSVEMLKSEPLPPDGKLGYQWQADIKIDCICNLDEVSYYPPPEPGEVEKDETRFEGAENFLRIPAWIVYAIMSENREGYTDSLLTIDDIQPTGYEYVPGDYDGVADLWAISQTFTIWFEMEAEP